MDNIGWQEVDVNQTYKDELHYRDLCHAYGRAGKHRKYKNEETMRACLRAKRKKRRR